MKSNEPKKENPDALALGGAEDSLGSKQLDRLVDRRTWPPTLYASLPSPSACGCGSYMAPFVIGYCTRRAHLSWASGGRASVESTACTICSMSVIIPFAFAPWMRCHSLISQQVIMVFLCLSETYALSKYNDKAINVLFLGAAKKSFVPCTPLCPARLICSLPCVTSISWQTEP
ncbi:hypothetical protein BC939DRAFT_202706 [Gamsiella multidivaricata]|uniref:uncharacterized protein n=1 Tax=Gamsiella multidivaricata TaxID=101098 RepID=UPI0022203E27|nr:uncharacterized protein BC939DRAFT_202706 [Gamsiella multidivaricata]KAI7821739.1 hypothetical protein BC939DRAFT_202706 [Gamsiella multidivaricata]